jgi:glycosyltransferase involved in cell wall biosynthesis
MPTRGLAERAPIIKRALASVLCQRAVRPVPIVVVNGPDSDPALLRWLEKNRRIRLIRREPPGIPGALMTGRAAVDTEWFSALDDDDLYLPGALARRVDAIRSNSACDTVVTNGLRRDKDQDRLHMETMASVERDPLKALMAGNWMLPGAWLCRTDPFGTEFFRLMPEYLECTYLAIQFSLHGGLCFIDEPTVVWHTDTPASASKSREYVLGQATALRRLLELPLPERYERRLRRHVGEAWHKAAILHLNEGNLSDSWRSHLRSLTGTRGWRYAPYSLRLLAASFKR